MGLVNFFLIYIGIACLFCGSLKLFAVDYIRNGIEAIDKSGNDISEEFIPVAILLLSIAWPAIAIAFIGGSIYGLLTGGRNV